MLNFFKKNFWESNPPASSSKPVFECKICHGTFAMNEKPSEEYLICKACYIELGHYVDAFSQRIMDLQEKANEAARAGNYGEQLDFLKIMLKYLNEYKETYCDKGINVIGRDINQMINEVQEVYDETDKEWANKKQCSVMQRNVILEENMPATEEEWLSLQVIQDEAINNVINVCNTIENAGFGFSDGSSLGTEFIQAILNLLIYLALIDGDIDEIEKQIITEYIHIDDIDIHIEAAKKSIRQNEPLGIPLCMYAFVNVDRELINNNETSELALGAGTFFKQFGINFLYRSCTDIIPKKAAGLYQYLLNINNYLKMNDLAPISLDEFREVDAEAGDITNNTISQTPEESLEILMKELNELTGLGRVKNDINSLINLLKVQKLREERGFSRLPMSLHLVFSGNPGTGKTTVARLLAKIYRCLGLISTGQLIEIDRSGLVAGYVGQTAIKTQEVISKAKGGVLFIDEAYSLTENRGEEDYGKEAIDTLVKAMEDGRADFVVIVAGYPKQMENFLQSNPGLRSRFNKFIMFDDYCAEDLVLILKSMCAKAGLTLSDQAEQQAFSYFEKRCGLQLPTFANARDVRNYFEKALVNQANRLAEIGNVADNILLTIEYEDIAHITLDEE